MVHYLILCLLFCSGCYQKPQNISSKRTQLHLSLRYDPLTLDPRKNSDPVSCSVINFLYTGLTQLEADGSISLNLADSIEASKGYTKYTFHLKDALWSNGEPITAYDFEYSWKKLLSPSFNSLNAHFLYPIKNAKLAKLGLVSTEEVAIFVEDAKTFYVRLEQPNTYFPKVLAFATCFPIWKNTKDPDDKNNAKVFSGAYILEDWKPNDSILLKKNPYYWNTENILIDTVKLHIVHDEQTILQLYQKNELDCIGSVVSPIPHDLIPHVKNSQEACSSDQA
ncbi:MAG: hypothetical protein FJZ63_05605, partial [Chlamydiae bacterium]|nr:hypothetical protein [Chlamydiota bacterium]